jgi:formylmethanofuran dehydrogenase subunit E
MNQLKESENNKTFSDVTKFHGHVCPGSALGFKAAEMALNELSSTKSIDEELVCIVENDSCAVDAVQVLTGCTFGKGNLIFNDYGKQVYTFISRDSGEGIRISLKSSFDMGKIDPEIGPLRAKIALGTATTAEKELLPQKIRSATEKILSMDEEDIFELKKIKVDPPKKASLYKSIKCDNCEEMVSEHRLKEQNDLKVCIPCFEKMKNKK